MARKLPAKGERADWWRAVVLFSRDAKEYQVLLDKPYTFRRLSPDGKRDAERTKEGRSYPRTFVTPEDQGDVPAPQVQPPAKPAAPRSSGAGSRFFSRLAEP